MPVFENYPKRNTDLYYHKGQCKLEHVCGHRLQHNKDKSVIIGTVNLTIFFEFSYIKIIKNIADYLRFK
jgi:hypothetical protein